MIFGRGRLGFAALAAAAVASYLYFSPDKFKELLSHGLRQPDPRAAVIRDAASGTVEHAAPSATPDGPLIEPADATAPPLPVGDSYAGPAHLHAARTESNPVPAELSGKPTMRVKPFMRTMSESIFTLDEDEDSASDVDFGDDAVFLDVPSLLSSLESLNSVNTVFTTSEDSLVDFGRPWSASSWVDVHMEDDEDIEVIVGASGTNPSTVGVEAPDVVDVAVPPHVDESADLYRSAGMSPTKLRLRRWNRQELSSTSSTGDDPEANAGSVAENDSAARAPDEVRDDALVPNSSSAPYAADAHGAAAESRTVAYSGFNYDSTKSNGLNAFMETYAATEPSAYSLAVADGIVPKMFAGTYGVRGNVGHIIRPRYLNIGGACNTMCQPSADARLNFLCYCLPPAAREPTAVGSLPDASCNNPGKFEEAQKAYCDFINAQRQVDSVLSVTPVHFDDQQLQRIRDTYTTISKMLRDLYGDIKPEDVDTSPADSPSTAGGSSVTAPSYLRDDAAGKNEVAIPTGFLRGQVADEERANAATHSTEENADCELGHVDEDEATYVVTEPTDENTDIGRERAADEERAYVVSEQTEACEDADLGYVEEEDPTYVVTEPIDTSTELGPRVAADGDTASDVSGGE
ncbi:pyruvate carboxylase subunit B [Babesia caballi]|uniref:Pyruvate carboxylase subunit B n=1 Tax=Babesia caballi TaxID=5871 RepID=A0AAV4LVA6_BABCB|nr:pyruvate carboxylase subunit B [Babesia caballi]